MDPSACHTAVLARLVAAGFTQALSPLGIRNESSQRIHKSFSVVPTSVGPATSQGRSKTRTDGIRVRQSFSIELGHQVKPGDGQDAPLTSLTDIHTAMKYLAVQNTTLTQSGAIDIGTASTTYVGKGAFIITSFIFSVEYNLTLVV